MDITPEHSDGGQNARVERARLQKQLPALQMRARMLASIRAHLDRLGFLAVETPIRLPAPALEDYIDAEPSGEQWLRTSPELHMKRLLAAGYERIYQIGPCFRAGERGRRHLPEFAMLEWYRRNANWRDILQDTQSLLPQVLYDCRQSNRCRFRGSDIDFTPPWPEIKVEEAFRKYASCELDHCLANGTFEQVLVEQIEPRLGFDKPLILSEYPLACSGLSQAIPGQPDRVERWELYVCGLELGNACSELLEKEEQERRFAACAALRRQQNRPIYPLDQTFLQTLQLGLPPTAGIAIGLDRLAMILNNIDDIAEVVPFPES